jgi:hypothetical protein
MVDVLRRTPPLQSSTNFASSYKKYARSGRKSYRMYHRNFTYGHLFRSLRAVQGHGAPQPGLKLSVRIRIRSCRAFMIRSMLVPLWLRRVQLWLCTLSVETNVCAVPSKSCFRCCSLTVYPRPPDRVSFSILLGSILFQVCTVCLVLYLLISTQWAALYVNV